MNVMVLVSGRIDDKKLGELGRLIDKLEQDTGNITITIITSHELISLLGPKIKKHIIHRVEIIAFNDRYPEENSLKLIVNKLPDIIIDMDYSQRLSFLKNIIQRMNKPIIKISG